MNFTAIDQKKAILDSARSKLDKTFFSNLEQEFVIDYTHNSTAIEGNTLTLLETKVVLEDHVAVGGKELREIHEVVNHGAAFAYVKACIGDGVLLDERTIKDIHALLMKNIMDGGAYRTVAVRISGAGHRPPSPEQMHQDLARFYEQLKLNTGVMHPIELAAWTHAEFVRVHPFQDGNGRTSRLLMNYQLMGAGYVPVSISKQSRLAYYEALDTYGVDGILEPFTEMVAKLEEEKLNDYIAVIQSQA